MEPERKIETWLRAYAKKRRGQAGDSFKLAPVTRRILQNEVSGNAPSSDADDKGISLWMLFRRHWAFFLGFAACFLIVASFFFRRLNTAQTQAVLSMSAHPAHKDNTRQIQGAVQGPLANNESPSTNNQAVAISDNIQSASPAKWDFVTNQNSPQIPAKIRSLPESSVPVYSQNVVGYITNVTKANFASLPPNKPSAEVANNASASAPPPPTPESLDTTTQRVTPPLTMIPPAPSGGGGGYAMAPTPANSLLQVPAMGALPGKSRPPSGRPGTAGQFEAIQNGFVNTIGSPSQSSPVLMNFQVERSGNWIRVVDQDGSVYAGMLHAEDWKANAASEDIPAATESAAAFPASAGEKTATTKVESPRRAESDQLAQPAPEKRHWHFHWPSWSFGASTATASIPAGAAMPVSEGALPQPNPDAGGFSPTQIYYFRVSGLNRTLNQPVLFTATLAGDLSAMKPGQTNQMGQLPWSSVRIAGMAIVNRTNQIQINATPVNSAKNSAPPAN